MNALKSVTETKTAIAIGIEEACKIAKNFEDSGEYESAADVIHHWWNRVGVKPRLEGLTKTEKGMILSRAGALTGWLGSARQITDSQEKAKDLLSQGADIFQQAGDMQNWAEARSDLAICYWREGSFDEARDFLLDTLADMGEIDPVIKGKIFLRLVNVEISSHNYSSAASVLKQAVPLIEEHGDHLLRGKLYFHRALINRRRAEETENSELLASATKDYALAGKHYKKALHQRYSAMVENNLGFLYLSIGDSRRAHAHLKEALKIYTEVKDMGRAALVYDNMARTFLNENKLADAEGAARTSVMLLQEGGEQSALAESFTTLGTILSRRKNFALAIQAFTDAKNAALSVGDSESAGNAVLTHIEELRSDLTGTEFHILYLEADELLQNSPRLKTVKRLQEIGRSVTSELFSDKSETTVVGDIDWENYSLPDAIHAFESEIILRAINESSGRVTKAAKMLGLSHQNLSLILHQRHKELKKFCVQRKPRSKSKAKTH